MQNEVIIKVAAESEDIEAGKQEQIFSKKDKEKTRIFYRKFDEKVMVLEAKTSQSV